MRGPTVLLPTVDLCGRHVSRLIVGGNPFRGYSHRSPELDREMTEYYTRQNIVRTLLECERHGINTMLSRGDAVIFDAVRAYRDAGGLMHWIAQTASEHPDFRQNTRDIASLGPIGIYFHGSEPDNRWKAGRVDSIRDELKIIRDTGVAVGFASHMPEVFSHVEERAWDIDFYLTCFYNISKLARGSMLAGAPRVEEPFEDEDRDVICEFIRSTAKPCLAYKILGASRHADTPERLQAAFRFAFEHIKPGDAVVVGVFQRHANQVEADARLVGALAAGG